MGCRWDHDLQAGYVRIDGFGRFRVVLGGTDASSIGHPDHHRSRETVIGPIPNAGHVVDDLVVSRVGEAKELELRYGSHTRNGHAERGTNDPGLGDRCVENTILAVSIAETIRDPEHPTGAADVFAEENHTLVCVERRVERTV